MTNQERKVQGERCAAWETLSKRERELEEMRDKLISVSGNASEIRDVSVSFRGVDFKHVEIFGCFGSYEISRLLLPKVDSLLADVRKQKAAL